MSIQSIGTRRPDLETIQVHYVPPAKGGNIFAGYAAEFLNVVTPLALEAHQRRLRALDPVQRREAAMRLARAAGSGHRQRAESSGTYDRRRKDLEDRFDLYNKELNQRIDTLSELERGTFEALEALGPEPLTPEQRVEIEDLLNTNIGGMASDVATNPVALQRKVQAVVKELVTTQKVSEKQVSEVLPLLNKAIQGRLMTVLGSQTTDDPRLQQLEVVAKTGMLGLMLSSTGSRRAPELTQLTDRIDELRGMIADIERQIGGLPAAPTQAAMAAAPGEDLVTFAKNILRRVPAENRPKALEVIEIIAQKMEPYGDKMVMAAITNAFAESQLDPNAITGQSPWDPAGYGEDKAQQAEANAVGVFQINSDSGFFKGRSYEDRIDPEKNVDMIIEKIKSSHGDELRRLVESDASVEEISEAFLRDIEEPGDPDADAVIRGKLLRDNLPAAAAPPTYRDELTTRARSLTTPARTVAPATQSRFDIDLDELDEGTGLLGAPGTTVPGLERRDRLGIRSGQFGRDIAGQTRRQRMFDKLIDERRAERRRRGGDLTRGDIRRAMKQVNEATFDEPDEDERSRQEIERDIAELMIDAGVRDLAQGEQPEDAPEVQAELDQAKAEFRRAQAEAERKQAATRQPAQPVQAEPVGESVFEDELPYYVRAPEEDDVIDIDSLFEPQSMPDSPQPVESQSDALEPYLDAVKAGARVRPRPEAKGASGGRFGQARPEAPYRPRRLTPDEELLEASILESEAAADRMQQSGMLAPQLTPEEKRLRQMGAEYGYAPTVRGEPATAPTVTAASEIYRQESPEVGARFALPQEEQDILLPQEEPTILTGEAANLERYTRDLFERPAPALEPQFYLPQQEQPIFTGDPAGLERYARNAAEAVPDQLLEAAQQAQELVVPAPAIVPGGPAPVSREPVMPAPAIVPGGPAPVSREPVMPAPAIVPGGPAPVARDVVPAAATEIDLTGLFDYDPPDSLTPFMQSQAKVDQAKAEFRRAQAASMRPRPQLEQQYPTVMMLPPGVQQKAFDRAVSLERQGATPEQIALLLQTEFGGM